MQPDQNPARDRRRAQRAEEERRRASRALDRLINGHGGLPAAEEFVESFANYFESNLHHNGHYGVPAECTCPPPYGRSTAPNPYCPRHRCVGGGDGDAPTNAEREAWLKRPGPITGDEVLRFAPGPVAYADLCGGDDEDDGGDYFRALDRRS